MNPHERGQVAAEFMLYTTVFMFVVVAAYLVINQTERTEVAQSQNDVAKETGQGFANIITLAVKGGEGFHYAYGFPQTLFGTAYVMDLRQLQGNYLVTLEWSGPYGNYSRQYALPPYKYSTSGTCLQNAVLVSNDNCTSILVLDNDGENLTITRDG